jgi:LVIVD repeat
LRDAVASLLAIALLLSGCGSPASVAPFAVSSVIPSASGTPNFIATFANFVFVTVQGAGQIVSYKNSGGSLTLATPPYTTPCASPSGLATTTIAGQNILAVVCYDTGSLLTLTINANGSLSPLGSISGLAVPYPGIVLDGTNLFVPLFGGPSTNGGVARISLASPASPLLTGTVALASPIPGAIVNAGYLAAASGYLYATAGSESAPLASTSSMQVIQESTMTLVGAPLITPHSPQQIAVAGTAAYITLFDTSQLESIDISNPASLRQIEITTLSTPSQGCHPIPVVTMGTVAYVGCFEEGAVEQLDISNPAQMQLTHIIPGISFPQRLAVTPTSLLVTGATPGGAVYQISLP